MLNLKHPSARIVGACAAWLLLTAAVAPKIDWNTQIKNKPSTFPQNLIVDARVYNYPPQTPSVGLAAGTPTTVTLTPCPLGVLGTDTRLRFWLTGGAGTAESVASTGTGTCTSGAATGTVAFTPAFTHTGAWTISSSHAGIYEAIAANPGREVRMPAGLYTMRDCMSLNPSRALILSGDSPSPAVGTFLNFGTVTSGCHGISMVDTAVNNNERKIFRDFDIQGTGTTVGGNGFYLEQVVRVTFDNMQVNSFALNGISTLNAFEVTITNGTAIFFNGQWGVSMAGLSNSNRIEKSYVGTNSRSNGAGSVSISGPSALVPTEQVTLDGVDVSNSGTMPFTTVTTSYGIFAQYVTGLRIVNCYNEGNMTAASIYQGGASGISETNNWYNSAPIVYAADVAGVVSSGNTFYGTAAVRIFNNPSLAGYLIGPDKCLNGSTECTTHPQMGGTPTLAAFTFATLPVKPNGTQLYCSDCTATCSAGGSTGRSCVRENGVWVH